MYKLICLMYLVKNIVLVLCCSRVFITYIWVVDSMI
jgi:hypothetical protein